MIIVFLLTFLLFSCSHDVPKTKSRCINADSVNNLYFYTDSTKNEYIINIKI